MCHAVTFLFSWDCIRHFCCFKELWHRGPDSKMPLVCTLHDNRLLGLSCQKPHTFVLIGSRILLTCSLRHVLYLTWNVFCAFVLVLQSVLLRFCMIYFPIFFTLAALALGQSYNFSILEQTTIIEKDRVKIELNQDLCNSLIHIIRGCFTSTGANHMPVKKPWQTWVIYGKDIAAKMMYQPQDHISFLLKVFCCPPELWHKGPGPRLNIKTVLSTYDDFHVKDKTAVRTSYL